MAVKTLWERDRELAAQGVPMCPRCFERDQVQRMPCTDPPQFWCDRCQGWLTALAPKPGRRVPDF